MQTIRSLLVSATLLQACACAAAPPRELVHPFPPGGPIEVIGATRASRSLRAMQRYAAPAFTDALAAHVASTLQGQAADRVGVMRRHRRGGGEALLAVESAAPDGSVLLLAPVPITPVRTQSTPAARLEPLASIARMPYAWASHNDLRDLGGLLRGGTMRLLTAHPGERTVAYWPLDRLRADPAIALEPVAYNGGMAALNALASAHVAAALVPLPAVLPYAGSGRIRVLAIADGVRHETLPDVPTTAESGLRDGEAVLGFSVFAPPGTPQTIRRATAAALSRVADAEDARNLLLDYGIRLKYSAAP